MSRAAVLGVVLALCSTARAEDADDTLLIAVPRPQVPRLDKYAPKPPPPPPDTSGYLRWPLGMRHPSLEPSFRIASALASSGVSWLQLCERGAQSRRTTKDRELTEYLHAWCDVSAHDSAAALARLAPLSRSLNRSLREAVRLDVASIAVDIGPGDRAERAIADAKLGSVEVYDLISAAFADLDDKASAELFNDLALGADKDVSNADHCHRLARRILLDPDTAQRARIWFSNASDPTCVRIEEEIACGQYNVCRPPPSDQPQGLLLAYKYWPTWQTNSWHEVVRDLATYRDLPDVDRLLVPAIEAAIKARKCDHIVVAEMRDEAGRIKANPAHDKSLDRRLDVILKPGSLCRAR